MIYFNAAKTQRSVTTNKNCKISADITMASPTFLNGVTFTKRLHQHTDVSDFQTWLTVFKCFSLPANFKYNPPSSTTLPRRGFCSEIYSQSAKFYSQIRNTLDWRTRTNWRYCTPFSEVPSSRPQPFLLIFYIC